MAALNSDSNQLMADYRLKTPLTEADLSPENLCCDGELRGAKLRAKSNMLNGAKADLQRLAEGKGYTILDPWRAFM